jgi:hypothetical protein
MQATKNQSIMGTLVQAATFGATDLSSSSIRRHFFPTTLSFYLRLKSPGLLQRLPSLPGRSRTVVLTHRLPCVTPWQSRICPLVTQETFVRHSHSCVAWRLENWLPCSVAALLITAEAVRSEQYQSLFVWKNTVLFVSIVCLFKVDTLVTGHSARSLKSS